MHGRSQHGSSSAIRVTRLYGPNILQMCVRLHCRVGNILTCRPLRTAGNADVDINGLLGHCVTRPKVLHR